MTWTLELELIVGCAVLSAALTGIVYLWLRRVRIVDVPNDRSSHALPTPIGGGLAVVPLIAAIWLTLAVLGMVDVWRIGAVIAVAVGLAVVGWRDDREGIGILPRLGAQALAVAVGLAVLPGHGMIFQGLLPEWADLTATGLLWLWFVNLFNFMDGIDGISGVEAMAIGIGVALVSLFVGEYEAGGIPLGITYASVMLGFLMWNWHPARLFLGDVGSVPVGFLGGWLLLSLAGHGHWAPALILPLYYLLDASLTLLWRLITFRAFWRPHREHIYQRAVQRGRSHGAVVTRILLADLALVGLAVLAALWPFLGVVLGLAVTIFLMIHLMRSDAPVA